jgi:phospholipid-transporting ATPase
MFTEAAIQFFNLFYTSLPIIILGVYDTDLAREFVYRNPRLYQCGVGNQLFNVRPISSSHPLRASLSQGKIFWWQILNAVCDAVVITYLSIFQLTTFSRYGVDESLWNFGALIFTAVVVLANLKVSYPLLALLTAPQAGYLICQWTIFHLLLLLLSIASWFLIALIVSNSFLVDANWYQVSPPLPFLSPFLARPCPAPPLNRPPPLGSSGKRFCKTRPSG